MSEAFDAVVVGSGFGGAVSACRLAERGWNVLVLERGRWWLPRDYPRAPGDDWIWDQSRPERFNGWVDLRWFRRMGVAQGAGVGGGSLIFANVVVDANDGTFAQGWPAEITADALRPYYDRVARMLNVQTLPANQTTARFQLLEEAATKAGYGHRFRALPLAVTFDPEWHYGLDDPFSGRQTKMWMNEHGLMQGTCVHCGNCDIGCQVRAKNTLDLNYLARAEKSGAEIRPLHLVRSVEPQEGGGYRVHFDRIDRGQRTPGSVTSRVVVLAAGSLGSTELLLRCRDEHETLPQISAYLGKRWSSNADFLTPAFYKTRVISPTRGPTITCAVDFLDGAESGEQFFIEDGGFPDMLHNLSETAKPRGRRTTLLMAPVEAPNGVTEMHRTMTQAVALARAGRQWNFSMRNAVRTLARLSGRDDPMNHTMPWFAQGLDAADGELFLDRRRGKRGRQLGMRWDIRRSRSVIDAIVSMHDRLSRATGGRVRVPPSWSMFKQLITPHPLGGCNMGTTRANGVVNHRGEVFGYPGLYVADGSIVPRPIGLNPSKTIAALAERIAESIAADGGARRV
jgi:cholesterol oxidase